MLFCKECQITHKKDNFSLKQQRNNNDRTRYCLIPKYGKPMAISINDQVLYCYLCEHNRYLNDFSIFQQNKREQQMKTSSNYKIYCKDHDLDNDEKYTRNIDSINIENESEKSTSGSEYDDDSIEYESDASSSQSSSSQSSSQSSEIKKGKEIKQKMNKKLVIDSDEEDDVLVDVVQPTTSTNIIPVVVNPIPVVVNPIPPNLTKRAKTLADVVEEEEPSGIKLPQSLIKTIQEQIYNDLVHEARIQIKKELEKTAVLPISVIKQLIKDEKQKKNNV